MHVQSYLRDTIDFLNYLPKTVPESTILVSLDVTGLCTNINHKFGIKAMEYYSLLDLALRGHILEPNLVA